METGDRNVSVQLLGRRAMQQRAGVMHGVNMHARDTPPYGNIPVGTSDITWSLCCKAIALLQYCAKGRVWVRFSFFYFQVTLNVIEPLNF